MLVKKYDIPVFRLGNPNRNQTPTGTIARTVFDHLERPISSWMGTNDSGATDTDPSGGGAGGNNMIQVSSQQYDNNVIGDSNVTAAIVYPDGAGSSASQRETDYLYDWRDRRVVSKQGVQGGEDSGTHRPIGYTIYNNLDEVLTQQRYDGDTIDLNTLGSTNGVPNPPAANRLRAQTGAQYDDQGRVFQTQVFSVNPGTGVVSATALTGNLWYDHRGQVIKTTAPGGSVEKDQYDGAGRLLKTFQTDGRLDATWTDAGTVSSNNNVLQEMVTGYDGNGNVIQRTDYQRFHDETAGGPLDAPHGPKARVSYQGAYFDAADRVTATVAVGTNAGAAWTRPSGAPTASDTALVSLYGYSAAGWVNSVTDPRGIVTRTSYDDLSRATQTIAAYTNGIPTSNTNKTTNFTYDGDNHLLTLTAVQYVGTTQTNQTTRYIYGVTTGTGGSAVNSNDALSAMQYPDKSTGTPSASEQETYTVNALGQTRTALDRNGSTHTDSYDVLGRLTSDAVTTLGSNVDPAVRRLDTAYDSQGNANLFTSFNLPGVGGVIVNQVRRQFNGLGQLTAEYQEHAGTVDLANTFQAQYAYSEMAGGANHSRPVSVTYPTNMANPTNKVVSSVYGAGLDDSLSRLTSISDGTWTLEAYSYLGLDTVVKRAHPQPGVDLTYVKQTGENNGPAGDQYTGLDQFGRVVDQRWLPTAAPLLPTDRFGYGYDRDGNRLYRDNLVNPTFGELYHLSGAGNGYDQLNQLTNFVRGTLNATKDGLSGTASRSLDWSLDAQGNWTSLATNGGSAVTRGHNQQNQVTGVGAATLQFDKNGDTTTDEQGQTYVFDAWNRLVQVKSGGTVLATYAYDALGRRIVENSGGTVRDVYFSADWQVLEERVSGQAQVQYVWSPVHVDALVLRDRDPNGGGTLSERLYAQQDANGNVTALVNTLGGVVERYVYDPYGKATALDPGWQPTDPTVYNMVYLHQGGRYDAATGLYNFRARDFSPTLGRWMEDDPLRLGAGDTNLYRTEANSPSNGTDPSGEFWSWIGAGVGAIQGVIVGTVVGGVTYVGRSLIRGQPMSWRGFAGATVGGAIGGAITGAVVGAAAGAAAGDPSALAVLGIVAASGVGGWLGGGAQSAVNQWIVAGRIEVTQVMEDAKTGLVVSLVTAGIVSTPSLLGNFGPPAGGGLAPAFEGMGRLEVQMAGASEGQLATMRATDLLPGVVCATNSDPSPGDGASDAPDNPHQHTNPDLIAEDMGPGHIRDHGDPANWTPVGQPRKIPSNARGADPGDMKVIEVWRNEFGKLIEYHYTRYADGTRSVGKLSPYSP